MVMNGDDGDAAGQTGRGRRQRRAPLRHADNVDADVAVRYDTAQRGLRNGYASNIGRHEMRVPERMCGGQLQTRHEIRRVHADEAAARDLAEAADEARSRAHRAHQAASNREAREAGHERAVERVT